MIIRIQRILLVVVLAALLANVQPALCGGWSIPNPFSSESKTASKKKARITKVVKKEPSVLEKIGDGTKNFFDRIGETLGLKQPAPKKYGYATAQAPRARGSKKTESKSWLPSILPPEESKKPKTVTDWMSQPRRDL